MQPILNFAAQVARTAGRELIARASQAPTFRSVSTQATEYLERTRQRAIRNMMRSIEKSYPDHEIFLDGNSLDEVAAETAWVINPIVGTTNFMRRSDQFCSVIAILRKKRFTHALVVDHFRDGQYHVTRTEGCFGNAGRMRVSDLRASADAVLATDGLQIDASDIEGTRRLSGCSGLDIVHTATGRYDAMILNSVSPLIYQVARLFIREAGGFASTLSGGEWQQPEDGLVAGNTFIHRQIVRALNQANQTETN